MGLETDIELQVGRAFDSFGNIVSYAVPNFFRNYIIDRPLMALMGVCGAVLFQFLVKMGLHYFRQGQAIKAARETRRKAQERIHRFVELTRDAKEEAIDAVKGSPEDLRKKLQDGELSAFDVVKASLSLSLNATLEFNCVTDVIADCLERAKRLDEERKETGVVGPLFGMPFSVKEMYEIEGEVVTLGLPTRCNSTPSSKNATLINVLLAQGAVPIVRTNIPQTLLTFECSNPVFGETDNPWKKGRSCGGSSGGESVLHLLKTVPFGLGTDIGGSVRIPAHFCGTCGLKPTSGRLSRRGIISSVNGQIHIKATAGPMAPTVDGLLLLMRSMCSDVLYHRDLSIPPLPFNEKMFNKKKLRIGVFSRRNHFFMKPTEGCLRAVDIAVDVLKKQNHEVVEVEMPDFEETILLFYAIMTADGTKTILHAMGDNPIDPRVAPLFKIAQVPSFIRALVKLMPENKITKIMSVTQEKTVEELWQLQAKLIEQTQKFLDIFESEKLDAILCVSSVVPACRQGHCSAVTPVVWPTFIYNALNCPAGIVPVTSVAHYDDEQLSKFYKVEDNIDEKMKASCVGSSNLPLTVQVVGARWRDELVLRVMKEIESGIVTAVDEGGKIPLAPSTSSTTASSKNKNTEAKKNE
eukprot:m.76417 g.76417  ORF g.76417 m.76417 type:complete len:637 (-) comp11880_c0_seq2:2538-4448(-)